VDRTKGVGYFNLLITLIFFSTFEVVSKTVVDRIDSYQMNFLRFFIGGLVLFVIILAKREVAITGRELLWCTGLGIINVALSMNFLQLSLYMPDAKASVSAVIFSSNPIFVCVFAALIDKEKISIQKLAGLFTGIIGILTIFYEKLGGGLPGFKSPLFALLSAVLYGLFTVLGRKVSSRIGSLKMNTYCFLTGSLAMLPLFLFTDSRMPVVDVMSIVKILYLAVFVTGVAYMAYFKGLSIVGTTNGSLVFFLKPALASLIAIMFLNEKASLNLFLGTALIIAGVVIVVRFGDIKRDIPQKG
jgi:drug/metabolite transporter (DMT)-like permease